MDDLWQTFFGCESRGFEFLKSNVWQIDSYDVAVTLDPDEHSIVASSGQQIIFNLRRIAAYEWDRAAEAVIAR